MNNKDQSGPAFPHHDDSRGITKRDLFALVVLCKIMSSNPLRPHDAIAKDAYDLADAMLSKRDE